MAVSQISNVPVLSKELKDMSAIVESYQLYCDLGQEKILNESLLDDPDAEIRDMAEMELKELDQRLSAMTEQLMLMLIPKDPDDDKNVYLEIRAGAGGQEAALFVLDLLRMYQLYAQTVKWRFEVVSQQEAEQGGLRSYTSCKGSDVAAALKYESGTYRVQRVPVTESLGRIHTSTCTVAILPESDEIISVDINPSDLRIDTRSSGAGGQHVNTTDSAVNIICLQGLL